MLRIKQFTLATALIGACACQAWGTLPPASEEAKAQAEQTRAKSAWQDKVAAYQLCQSQDKVAEAYRRSQKAEGKPVPPPASGTPCQDPGPYASPLLQKPLEASGAHSPPGMATTPPSQKATAAETLGTKKPQ
ncbi:MAG: hypothetical protein U1F54_13275 [Burkholderiales bacterium]